MAPCDEVVHLRRAKPEDARGIAEVHVRTLRDAYRGELPAAYLHALSVDEREGYWARELASLPHERQPWVAEAKDQIIGFVTAGPARDDKAPPGSGEVYAIFVLPECWERGVGRSLLAHAERDLLAHGYDQAVIWMPADNMRARYFHEQAGWHADGETHTRKMAGTDVMEIRYRTTLDKSRVASLV